MKYDFFYIAKDVFNILTNDTSTYEFNIHINGEFRFSLSTYLFTTFKLITLEQNSYQILKANNFKMVSNFLERRNPHSSY